MEINWRYKSLGILCFKYQIWLIFIYGKIQPQWCAQYCISCVRYLICCVKHDILRTADEFYSRNSFLFWYPKIYHCHKSLPLLSIQNHFICPYFGSNPEDGDSMFLWSIWTYTPYYYMVSWPRRLQHQSSLPWKLWILHSLIWFSSLQPSSSLRITISKVVSFYLVILSKSLTHSSFHQTYSKPSTSQLACDLSLGRR
jgi:hypothetical protein